MCKVKLQNLSQFTSCYPEKLIRAILEVAGKENKQLYVVGGTIRDFLLGKESNDLDISVSKGSSAIVRQLIRLLKGGAFVDLSGPRDEGARLVWENVQIDVADFRLGAESIAEDLRLRDFTINGIGAEIEHLAGGAESFGLIDPGGGCADLAAGLLRHCPGAFVDDPVRMLRGYRLFATLGFTFAAATEKEIVKHASLIERSSVERLSYELELIFNSSRTSSTLWAMHGTGLLGKIMPELYLGAGVLQPRFHHLDVFEHNMLALEMMEDIVIDPCRFFPGIETKVWTYIQGGAVAGLLKWAALFHDVGKPAARGLSEKEEGRVTFYAHDEIGRDIFYRFARRMRWSKRDTEHVAALINMHMHPFHLCNIERVGKISKRAALKLCQRAGDLLPGLFLLAMSDSLAGQGELKPANMEDEIVALLKTVMAIYEENIRPVLNGPPLLSGRDLIHEFALAPGPIFAEILTRLDIVRVEGTVTTRSQALAWVRDFLAKR